MRATSAQLTRLERDVLDAVSVHLKQHSESPTVAELTATLGLRSRGTVHRYLTKLIEKGHLQKEGRGWRSLRLTDLAQRQATVPEKPKARPGRSGAKLKAVKTSATASLKTPEPLEDSMPGVPVTAETLGNLVAVSIPMLGRIAAGLPIEAVEDQQSINLGEFLLGPDRYALRVTGDSMIEAGILDGDTVILRKQSTAQKGEIVVALIDGSEATLKRLGDQREGIVELRPENPYMQTMRYAAERVRIQGVLVGQMRGY